MNLRALITTKTAELDQLIQQLRLIDQVLTHVEHGTEQIEQVLKDLTSRVELVYAEATLNSALQSACLLSSSIPTCAKKVKQSEDTIEEEEEKIHYSLLAKFNPSK